MKTFTGRKHILLAGFKSGFNQDSTDTEVHSNTHSIKRNTLFRSAIVSAAVLSIGLLLSSAAAANGSPDPISCSIDNGDPTKVVCASSVNGAFTFTVPTGVDVEEIKVELWGAGGGGGAGGEDFQTNSRGGGGGGGGAYTTANIPVEGGDVFSLTVGTGGLEATDGTSSSVSGGSLAVAVEADGGSGGQSFTSGNAASCSSGSVNNAGTDCNNSNASFTAAAPGSDGDGGAGGAAGTQAGGAGGDGNQRGGGGGGSATTTSAGGAGANGSSDTNTAALGGSGEGAGGNGASSGSGNDATPGLSPGGGGGGGTSSNTGGAAGADGKIIITYTANPKIVFVPDEEAITIKVGDAPTVISFDALDALGESQASGIAFNSSSDNGGEVESTEGNSSVSITGKRAGEVTLTASKTGFADASITITVVPTAPSPPQNVKVVPGVESLIVNWDASLDDGGAPITQYIASANPSCVVEVDADNQNGSFGCTITGVDPDESYTVTVVAVNGSDDQGGTSAPAEVAASPETTPLPSTNPNPESAPVPVPTLGLVGLLLLILMMGLMVVSSRHDSLQTLRSS